MTDSFHYSTTYILNKEMFSETFDETNVVDPSKNLYAKAIILALSGLMLMYFTQLDRYFCWFLIALGGVEALSVRFQKPWWLARQLISKAANNELTLTIDENGVHSRSLYVDSKLPWQDITAIEPTSRGWLLHSAGGRSYLSNRYLSEQAQSFLAQKAEDLQNATANSVMDAGNDSANGNEAS